MKKIIISFLSLIVVLSLCLSTSVSAAVAPPTNFKNSLPGWGTEEDGIIPKHSQNYPPYHNAWTETNGLPNTQFDKGLMYWSSCRANNPTDNVDIVSDDSGNKYLKFGDSKTTWQGIESVPFVENRVKAGDNVVIVFDWRVDPNFQVYLHQIVYTSPDGSKNEPKRIAHNGDAKRNEIIVDGENGWNTAFCKPDRAIMQPDPAMPNYYFGWGVQICQDTSCEAEVDNLRMAIWRESSNCLYDLDGNLMYDLNNLDTVEGEDFLSEGMFPEFDYDVTYEDVYNADGSSKNDASGDNGGNWFANWFYKDGSFTWVFYVAIVAAVVILILAAAAVVVIIVVVSKKKKKAALAEDSDTQEIPENTLEDDQ